MNIEIYKQQTEQAKANIGKSYLELKVGDFVFADGCGLKNEGVAGVLYDMSNGDCLYPNRLCFIEKITHCKDADLISNRFEFGSGGSRSDCFDDNEFNRYHYTQEQIRTFYEVVTLIIADDTGRYAFSNAEGYDYPRYLLFRAGWREMFAVEIQAETKHRADLAEKYRREEQERMEKERVEQEQKIKENFAYLDIKKSKKANWIAICRHVFPFPVRVSKHKIYDSYEITLYCRNEEERLQVKHFVDCCRNDFNYCTGETGIGGDGYPYVTYGNRLEDHVPDLMSNISSEVELFT